MEDDGGFIAPEDGWNGNGTFVCYTVCLRVYIILCCRCSLRGLIDCSGLFDINSRFGIYGRMAKFCITKFQYSTTLKTDL